MSLSLPDCFPRGKTPRPVQEDTLRKIEQAWDSSDVLVVNLPVATGKSYIALAIASWAIRALKLDSSLITPTNILVDQYVQDFPRLHSLKRMGLYRCEMDTPERPLSCADTKEECGKACKGCPYTAAIRKAHAVPYTVSNYYIYFHHKLYSKVLIVDEAHNLVPMIRDLASKKLWTHQYHFPENIRSYGALLRWVEANPLLEEDPKLQLLHAELVNSKTRFLVERGEEEYRGEPRDCIKLLPVDIRDQPPYLWPTGKVEKIILLSATIGPKDIEQLGLDKRRVTFLSASSPIPPEQRPVQYQPVASMALLSLDRGVESLASRIRELLRGHSEKGFIHATYKVAELLRPLLAGESRLLFHTREDKMDKYREYRESHPDQGKVLIASGLYEGVDLPEDMGRWQVIAKVPWPNLGEPAIRYLMEQDPSWYAWETVKVILQASGRICRTPEDYGLTYILDNSFERLFNQNQELFPEWYQHSLTERE